MPVAGVEHSTSWPSCSSRSHRCEPMKPAPPVTKTRCSFSMALNSPAFGNNLDALVSEVKQPFNRGNDMRKHFARDIDDKSVRALAV